MLAFPLCFVCFFLMIRRPPRSTLDRSSAASDVYKRQGGALALIEVLAREDHLSVARLQVEHVLAGRGTLAVSYTHLRAHETVLDIVCRLLLEKKKRYINKKTIYAIYRNHIHQLKSIDNQNTRPKRHE